MFRSIALAACLVLLIHQTSRAQNKPTDDDAELARLRGVWHLVFEEKDGKATPSEQMRKIRVEIKNRTHSVYFGDQEVAHEIPFTFNPNLDPKTTDDTLTEGPDKGKQIHGIYRIDRDSLVSCVAETGADRPREFKAGPGTGHTLRVFQRSRPGDGPEKQALREELMRFNGTWRFEELTTGGQKVPAEAIKNNRLIVQGDQFISQVSGVSLGGYYVANPSVTPKTIDIVFTEGPSPGATVQGIYELDEETYKVCFSLDGKTRPTAFDSQPGSKQMLEILKREKPAAP